MKHSNIRNSLAVHYLRAASFALAMAWAVPGHGWDDGDEEKCPLHGHYVNYYGFRVTLPQGLKGCPNSPVGMSDHGVEIPLDPQRQRVINVFAAYNATLDETVADSIARNIDSFREDQAVTAVRVISRTASRLGGLRAERVVLRYRVKETGEEMVFDSSDALRSVIKPYTEPSHSYSVSLTTPAKFYKADRLVLQQVLASWHQAATEDDPPGKHKKLIGQ